jgi:hypothetical protein
MPGHILGDRDAGMTENLGDDIQRRALGAEATFGQRWRF